MTNAPATLGVKMLQMLYLKLKMECDARGYYSVVKSMVLYWRKI